MWRTRKKWTGWRPKTDEQTIEFQKDVMRSRDEKKEEKLETIQRAVEDAAGKVESILRKTKIAK